MKNILLILVGGTICTANENNVLSITKDSGAVIRDNYLRSDSACVGKVNIDLSENLLTLSENMTVDKWNLIIDLYRKTVIKGKYDGVIFAHGTDSLAYSSSLFSFLLADTDVPVFFVSANENLSSERSNGNANFACAVECICYGISPNVYVPYKNLSDGKMYLHSGSRLEQCKNYSEDFYSAGAVCVEDHSEKAYKNAFAEIDGKYPQSGKNPILSLYNCKSLEDCVLMLEPYVGLRYDCFDYAKFRAVLHGTYHSGTACAEKSRWCADYGRNSLLYMLDECAERSMDTDIYLSPSRLEGEVYETLPIIANHRQAEKRLSFLYGQTNEASYAKLVIAYSVFADKEDIKRFLDTNINFENIH